MIFESKLKRLGFTDKEIAVYIALLELGRGTAIAIADKAGIKRPTTYLVLSDLKRRGLVYNIPNDKRQIFKAENPEKIEEQIDLEKQIFKDVLPELMLRFNNTNKKPAARFYEGEDGIDKLLNNNLDEMKGKEIVGFYANAEGYSKNVTEIIKDYLRKLKKNKITTKGIAPDHPSLKGYRKTDKNEGRDMKVIPMEKYSSNISIDCTDSQVRIVDIHNLQGLVIENPNIAKTVKQVFNMVWEKY